MPLISEEEIEAMEHTGFGCRYCGMMGYEDYPHNAIPCRRAGHREKADRVAQLSWAALDATRHDVNPNATCPYCKQKGHCEHYDGLGWSQTGAQWERNKMGQWVRK